MFRNNIIYFKVAHGTIKMKYFQQNDYNNELAKFVEYN